MSAKARFLHKLQEKQPRTNTHVSKGYADMAEFRQRLGTLRESIDSWLTGSGIRVIESHCSFTENLIGSAVFTMPAIELHFENRIVRLTPSFLYGQGVTGCVDVTLIADEQRAVLGRLFMRSAESTDWTCTTSLSAARNRIVMEEDTFFELITPLLPA